MTECLELWGPYTFYLLTGLGAFMALPLIGFGIGQYFATKNQVEEVQS